METETTNPLVEDDTAEATVPRNEGVEDQADDQLDADDAVEEDEEVDLGDDLKLTVPKSAVQRLKELKDGALRQADYTRKTQELAETRRAFEAERQQVVQSTNEELEAFATLRSLHEQLAQFKSVDWNAWYDRNPAGASKAHIQYQLIRDAYAGAQVQLSNARNQRLSAEQQKTAQLVEQGRQVLSQEIGWNDEHKAKLTDHALQRGLSRDDLSDLEANPAAAKILHDAYQWHQHQQKTKAAQRHETAQKVQPAASVSARRAPPAGLDDRLDADEWVRRRNEQLRKRG